jgi:hypothetical protein
LSETLRSKHKTQVAPPRSKNGQTWYKAVSSGGYAPHLWFGKSAILGRFLKQKFDLSKPCSWCSNRGRKPAWPPHSQPNTITTKKRQFEFLKKGDYGTQQIFHTFDVLKCQTVSKYGTKRPYCVFLFCASALRTLTADKRIEK